MVRCSVLGCKSNSEHKIPDLSFHSFPTHNNFCIRHWVVATGRQNWVPKKNSKICSKHFEKGLLNKVNRSTVLTPNAVPNLDCKLYTESDTSSHVLEPIVLINDNNLTSLNTSSDSDILDRESEDELSVTEHKDKNPHSDELEKSTTNTLRRFQINLIKAKEQSANRLRKLKALREKNRRLTKKVDHLEKVIAEIRGKPSQSATPILCNIVFH